MTDATIQTAAEQWERDTVAKVLQRFPERRTQFAASSAETRRLYTPLDTASLDWNMQAWARWFNEEYVPLKQREDQQLAAASTTRPAGTTPPKLPSGTP